MTKWKGKVASCAPHLASALSSLSTQALVVGLAAGGSLCLSVPARAGTCLLANAQLSICSGPASNVDGSYGVTFWGDGEVQTAADFGLSNPAGAGINVNGSGNITFDDRYNATISSSGIALDVTNSGNGDLVVKAPGTTISADSTAIFAEQQNGSGKNLSIVSGVADGGRNGIVALNDGAGALSVVSTTRANGSDNAGILASNRGTSLSITAQDVSGQVGISARNLGSGAMSISISGTVNGTNGDAISVENVSGSGLTVNAAGVSGTGYGIDARNRSSGALAITTTGPVTAMGGSGIFGTNSGAQATDLTVRSTSVSSSGLFGVAAWNYGSGSVSVSASGLVSAARSNAIDAYNSAIGTNLDVSATDTQGSNDGIVALNLGTGALTVTSTGTAAGGKHGIYAVSRAGTELTVIAADTKGDNGNGIYAVNQGRGALTVSSSGMASGTLHAGIYAKNSGNGGLLSIRANNTSGSSGIYAFNEAQNDIQILSTGLAEGKSGSGIDARNSPYGATISIESNNASGATSGIYALNRGNGNLTVTSSGTATGAANDGILVQNTGNASSITVESLNASGGRHGIEAIHYGKGDLTITSTGLAVGVTGDGIHADSYASGNSVSVSSRDAKGLFHGIYVSQVRGGAVTVDSSGMTEGGLNGSGIDVENGPSGSSVSIASKDASGGNGILARNSGTGELSIESTGLAMGQSGSGISASNLNALGAGNLVVSAYNTSGTLDAIYARQESTGSLTIRSSGAAISVVNGNGINALNSAGSSALTVNANNTSGTNGILAKNRGTGALMVTSSGTASGSGNGIVARGYTGTSVSVHAADTQGRDGSGISAYNTGAGALTITSTGMATGTVSGISGINGASGSSLSITASSASGARGILASNAGSGSTTVIATGVVSGSDGAGIFASTGPHTTSLSISAVNTRGQNGIYAANNGTGNLTVASTGIAVGTAQGIYARNGQSGQSLEITANSVAGRDGITAFNRGAGTTSITATGNVSGSAGTGIQASNTSNGKGMSIAATNTSGSSAGILAVNNGAGDLDITSSGIASASSGSAIYALNSKAGNNLTIVSSAVSGTSNGIRALNDGLGALRISATGPVVASLANSIGVSAQNGVQSTSISVRAMDAAGDAFGIRAINFGVGSTDVVALGTVTGKQAGIFVTSQPAGTGLTVTANTVSSATSAIVTNSFGREGATINLRGTAQGGTGAAIDTYSNPGDPGGRPEGSTAINLAYSSRVIAGSSGIAIRNNSGNSVLNASAGAVINGQVLLGGGSDVANLAGTDVLSGITLLDGGDDASSADGMIDRLALTGVSGAASGTVIKNWEVLSLVDSDLTFDGVTAETLNVCAGTTTLSGASLIGAGGISGCGSSESITLTGNTSVLGPVQGAGGGDIISVLGEASVTGSIYGAGAGQDNSAMADGADVITIRTSGSVGDIDSGAGDDIISLLGGTVGGDVRGGPGHDAIVLSGATVAGTIDGGEGNDTFTLVAGSAASVTAGDGDDALNWNSAAAHGRSIAMGNGSDTVNINASGIDLAGSVLDGGQGPGTDTLNFNNAWSGTLAGASVTNWETINVNAGKIRFSDADITVGTLNLNAGGQLDGSNSLRLNGNLGVNAGSAFLAGNEAFTTAAHVTGSVASSGVVDLHGTGGNGAVGDRLTIDGNLTNAAGSSIRLDASLGGSNKSDQIIVAGNLSGRATLVVSNVAGTGSLTSGDGIELVRVAGTSSDAALTLAAGRIDLGAFRYTLFKGGIDNASGSNWYLRSRARDIVVATMGLAGTAQNTALLSLGTHQERMGEGNGGPDRRSGFLAGAWGRAFGTDYTEHNRSAGLGDSRSIRQAGGFEMGLDVFRGVSAAGNSTTFGAYGGHVWSGASDFQGVRSGGSRAGGWVTGAYLNHSTLAGSYLEFVLQRERLSHVATAVDGTSAQARSYNALASIEAGRTIGATWKVEPQVQVVYSHTSFKDFTDSVGLTNVLNVHDSVAGRGGLTLRRTWDLDGANPGRSFTFYGKVNVWTTLAGGQARLAVGPSDPQTVGYKRSWGDAGIGTVFNLTRSAELFTDVSAGYGLTRRASSLSGHMGLRIHW